jgi:transcription elongation factor GreA
VVVDKSGQRDEYHIVGEFEADPMQKKLSTHLPNWSGTGGQKERRYCGSRHSSGKHTYTIVDVKVI